MFHRLKRIFLILLLFGGVFLSAANGLEERAPKWNVILEHFQLLVNNFNQTLQQRRSTIEQEFRNYDRVLFQTREQVAEFNFLLHGYNPKSGFELLMRCRQIADLKAEFGTYLANLRTSVGVLEAFKQVLENLNGDLETQKPLLAAELQPKLEQNIQLNRQLSAECEALLVSCQTYLDDFTNTENTVNELYDYSEIQRQKIIDGMFVDSGFGFVRSTSRFSLIDIRDIFSNWIINVTGWFELLIPVSCYYWLKLALLLAGLEIPALLFAKFRLIPWLRTKRMLQESSDKAIYFQAGLLFAVANFAMRLSTVWINSNEEVTIRTLAASLAAFSMLAFSLAFRQNPDGMRCSMRPYLPIILLHIIGVLLYISLAPFDVLLLVITPVNLLAAAATALLLYRRKYPWFDLAFGIGTIVLTLAAALLTALGYPYIGFTITMGWLIVLSRLQVTLVFSMTLFKYSSDAKLPLRGVAIRNFVLPLLWLWTFDKIFEWISDTYHIQNVVDNWMQHRIQLPQNLLSIAPQDILIALFAALTLQFLIKLAQAIVRNRYEDQPEAGLIYSTLTLGIYFAWVLYGLFVLVLMRAQYSSLLVMVGGLSMGLGLALKSVMENFIAAVTLLAGQQVRTGDYIEVDGIYARVRRISMRATRLETLSGAVVIVPNTQLVDKPFHNWTRNHKVRRCELPVDVAYGSDLALAMKLLKQAAAETEGVQNYPPSDAVCRSMESSSIRLSLYFWAPETRYFNVTSALILKITGLFAENGIEIPFNQLDVNWKDLPQSGENQS